MRVQLAPSCQLSAGWLLLDTSLLYAQSKHITKLFQILLVATKFCLHSLAFSHHIHASCTAPTSISNNHFTAINNITIHPTTVNSLKTQCDSPTPTHYPTQTAQISWYKQTQQQLAPRNYHPHETAAQAPPKPSWA
jgi:hypothetical protein